MTLMISHHVTSVNYFRPESLQQYKATQNKLKDLEEALVERQPT
jgi:hypothetical protein